MIKAYNAQQRYLELSSRRTQVLDTARMCAELTLPYLLTRSGHAQNQSLPETWQSIGAKGVSVMASKLLLAVMPPTTSFFKLQINDGEFISNPELNAQIKSEVDMVLSRTERIILQHISETQDRAALFGAFKQLVCTGNVLIYMPDKEDLVVFPLSRYVVERHGGQSISEIITVEVVSRDTLPKDFQTKEVEDTEGVEGSGPTSGLAMEEDEVEVFTVVEFEEEGDKVEWHQEADGKLIPGTEGQSKKDVCPWLPLRFNRVDGDDYGRGRIEEYLGDLRSLESLSQSLVEGAAGSARLIWLVDPGCASSPEKLAKARNLSFQVGREGEVSVVQAGKGSDLAVAQTMIQDLTGRLSEAFLVFTPRRSERTTAEEIRATQQELNEQLGGNLGYITVELLQPYLARKMYLLKKQKKLPDLPKGLVIPQIVTGMDGIGRGQDREALIIFAKTLQEVLGPEVMAQNIHSTELIKRLAASVGIDSLGLVKSDEELKQEKQGQMQEAQALQAQQNEPAMAKVAVDAAALQQQQGGPPVPPEMEQRQPQF